MYVCSVVYDWKICVKLTFYVSRKIYDSNFCVNLTQDEY